MVLACEAIRIHVWSRNFFLGFIMFYNRKTSNVNLKEEFNYDFKYTTFCLNLLQWNAHQPTKNYPYFTTSQKLQVNKGEYFLAKIILGSL